MKLDIKGVNLRAGLRHGFGPFGPVPCFDSFLHGTQDSNARDILHTSCSPSQPTRAHHTDL